MGNTVNKAKIFRFFIYKESLLGRLIKKVAPFVFYKKICYNIIIRNKEKKKDI
jgi:hypothetical protein